MSFHCLLVSGKIFIIWWFFFILSYFSLAAFKILSFNSLNMMYLEWMFYGYPIWSLLSYLDVYNNIFLWNVESFQPLFFGFFFLFLSLSSISWTPIIHISKCLMESIGTMGVFIFFNFCSLNWILSVDRSVHKYRNNMMPRVCAFSFPIIFVNDSCHYLSLSRV